MLSPPAAGANTSNMTQPLPSTSLRATQPSNSLSSTSAALSSPTQLSMKAEHLSQASAVPGQKSGRKRPRDSSLPSSRRNAAAEAAVDDEDDDAADDDDDEQATRTRPRHHVEVSEADQQSPPPSPSGNAQPGSRIVPLAQRSADGYLPGSIRRVALYQFVTFDFVEFRPGPHLNMIIGPNGTGKSTISSGIALGLGWSTSVLSRQKDLADFVKSDCQEGWIELELQGLPGQANIVIRRTLVKTDNTSDWFLNGRKSSKREVTERVGEFEIDISNLCSFLPQDKVAAFARMSSQEVLVETEKTAGDANLFRWHTKLEELGKVLAAREAALEQDLKQRDNLKERNEALERDVRRFEEREKMEMTIFQLKCKILQVRHDAARAELEALKEAKSEVKARLRAAEEAGAPMKAQKDELKAEIRQADGWIRGQREAMHGEEKSITQLGREIDRRIGELDALHGEMQSLKTLEEQRKKNIRDLKAEIAEREESIRAGPPEVDLSEIKKQLRSIDQEDRQAQDELYRVAALKNHILMESNNLARSRDELKARLESLADVKAQRLETLRRADPAAHTAVMWLRENQAMFQQPVYEPVLLEINVKDPAYANAVESCLNWPLMKTFVCQTRADYDLFTREVIDKRRMRVTVAEVENMELSKFRPPASPDQLCALGLDKYVLELIDGPRDVLTHLCNTAHLHTIPVARDESRVDIERVEGSRLFRRFVIGSTTFTVTYSAYGNKAAQTASRFVTPARNLAGSINDRLKNQLDGQIRTIQQKIAEQEAQMAPLIQSEASLRAERDDLAQRKAELQSEKRDKESVRSNWEKVKVVIEQKKKRLANEEQAPSVEAKRLSCLQRRKKLVHLRAQVAQKLKAAALRMIKLQAGLDVRSLEKLQLAANLRHVESLVEDHRTALGELVSEKEEASRRLQIAVTHYKRIAEESHALANNDQGFVPELDDEIEDSLEDLQANLSRQQAAYENAQGIRPGVKEQFDERKKEIAALDNKIAKAESDKAALQRRLELTKSKWQPALAELVSRISEKFSAAFDSIGCAGEVRIKEAEKFEDWGIEILVKFRDEASLQVLTGQQQSGGERSLSTIMYLMSLTELSRSPFSLVDEINQGMDQRAERSVHNHMVDVTCKDSASQYFLITPKLLTDLRYHEKMKILVVNNGDWASKPIGLRKYATKALRTNGNQ
ncbi:uncharacterized protein PFL1_02225 [Pseudozyma flocculosa PF-1]|uniref:uncharacterized protein n=1 Tax=Pseudozyma flocculosa PF-1 TaxID=1277687 RepID=UPI0004560EEF|nr:uncharacterized protein PFL1_02225 [Pseudozyma flocculosa PF-1]EPQ30108.1 hypothetical protein PFL1_02225 [Pseudozyma flocculosa PF-1]